MLASGLVACEGTTTLRCDPTPSWSYAPSDGGVDGAAGALAECTPSRCPVAGIESGARHTCARAWSGDVFCWGANEHGQSDPRQLEQDEVAPSAVYALGAASARPELEVGLGAAHTCVADGLTLACWGEPRVVGGRAGEIVEHAVGAPHGGVRAGAAHTCTHVAEVTGDGALSNVEARCFGAWDGLEVGEALGSLRVVDRALVAASGFVTCDTLELAGEGRIPCWGGTPPGGRLVPGRWIEREELVVETPVVSWALGPEHLCVQSGTTLRCRGRGDRGQLGDGRSASSEAFVTVQNLPPRPIVSMCIGGQGALRVDADGTLAAPTSGGFTCAIALQSIWCWGANHRGQLGDGTLTDRATPVRVRRIGVTAHRVTCGEAHACAQTSSGIWCWGDNSHGQLGVSSRQLGSTSLPIEVDLFPDE